MTQELLSVGVIGYGAVARDVCDALAKGVVPGIAVTGVVTRSGASPLAASLEEVVARSDLIVEAASHAALAACGPGIIAAGIDLIVVSVGGLVDTTLRSNLSTGPGRLLVSSGAIGGLGIVRAGALFGELDHVVLTTTKPSAVLEQDWMGAELVNAMRSSTKPLEVFAGTAGEAVQLFPNSVNVAATLALSGLGFERTRVRMLADPSAQLNRHVVKASGAMGEYEFTFQNRPSPSNPRSSALTARSVVRAIADRQSQLVAGV